jgi:hypothetical protein
MEMSGGMKRGDVSKATSYVASPMCSRKSVLPPVVELTVLLTPENDNVAAPDARCVRVCSPRGKQMIARNQRRIHAVSFRRDVVVTDEDFLDDDE